MSLSTFTIPGKPMGKGRPRFARMGKFVKTYTPKETASYENLVKLYYQQADGQMFPDRVPLGVSIFAHFETPKSWSKKKRAATIHHTGKPDCDNIGKIICDALNGVAWRDDSQVVSLTVMKLVTTGRPPRVVVDIWKIA